VFRNWINRFQRFNQSEDGPTAVEYAVMLALIMLACIGAVRSLATATGSSFDRSSQAISQAIGSG
jgi:pilus assembly protein Flp/PilA